MAITLLTGPPGSGKSRSLIETVNTALAGGRPVSTFLARAAILHSGDPNVWSTGKIGCREPGIECRLDHLVSSSECARILRGLRPGTLVALDEAHFFDAELAGEWIDASRRGLDVVVSTPSAEQVEILRPEAEEQRFTSPCDRCARREAVSTLLLPGEEDATSLCSPCETELVAAARSEILTRLQEQTPFPGEPAIYQPVELDECSSWRVLRPDSQTRVELMTALIDELADDQYPLRTYLDIGCNTGYFCHAMDRLGFAARGVDLVADDIAVARLLGAFIRRDRCRYTVADIYDYLRDTRTQPVDIVSAFSVVQWLILQKSLDHGLESLAWLFEKTNRLCFLEMGFSSEAIYRDKLPEHIDADWVRGVMEEKACFAEIRHYEAGAHGLMRDLFVGVKNPSSGSRSSLELDAVNLLSPYDDPDELARRIMPLVRRLLRPDVREKYFRLWESQGVHVTPVDCYQPIPDTASLTPDVWERTSDLIGVDMNVASQLRFLTNVFPRYVEECTKLSMHGRDDSNAFYLGNGMFDGTDALAYYCLVRHFEPRRIIHVGSPFAARVAVLAAEANGGADISIIPLRRGESAPEGIPPNVAIIDSPLADIDLEVFTSLRSGDVLFLDTSHVVAIGSDVTLAILEILPRLQTDVLIHIHDIFFPEDYPKEWLLQKGRFWTEQYLVQAFLAFNASFEIVLCNSFLGRHHQEAFKAAFPMSPWWGGGSLWLCRRDRTAVQAASPPD